MQRIITVLLILFGNHLFSSCQPTHSEWGENDQRGAMNRIGPEQVLSAAQLIRQGKTIELGHPYSADMPLSGKRNYQLSIPDSLRAGPHGSNKIVHNVEIIQSTLCQIGTQFDGLGHVGKRNFWGEDLYYNGYKGSEIVTGKGLAKLGVENVGAFFTRGILIDIPAYKNIGHVKEGYIISVEDIEGALKQENLEINIGDVVLVRTGIGQFWGNGTTMKNAPGLGISAIRWLAQKKIVMVGSDNSAVEALPGENKKHAIEGHEELLIQNGIYLFENLNLEELAKQKVYEFAFSYAPLKLKGATGSPGNPVAIY
jgi:kynurenine formamidase